MMRRRLGTAYILLTALGIDPLKGIRFVRGLPFYLRSRREFLRQRRAAGARLAMGRPHPIVDQRYADNGAARGHYFHQDLLVARRIFAGNPQRHVDIGSRVDGFVAHVAAFRPITVFDIRPLATPVTNITFVQADLMGELDEALVGYADSVSSLHALEHFGLGRYGDPICNEGYLLGLENIHRILRPGGRFYFSVPIGEQRVEFNAHRVFSVAYLLELLRADYRVDAFSYVDDRGDLHENVSLADPEKVASSFGCHYGCGIFELTRL